MSLLSRLAEALLAPVPVSWAPEWERVFEAAPEAPAAPGWQDLREVRDTPLRFDLATEKISVTFTP